MAFEKKSVILFAIVGLLIAASIIGILYMFASPKSPNIQGVAGSVTVVIANGTFEVIRPHHGVREKGVVISVEKMSQLEYAVYKRVEVQEEDTKASVDTIILKTTFFLETPRGEIIKQAEVNLEGKGLKNFKLIIGPKEGLTENGEYILRLKIYLKTAPSAGHDPITEKTIMIEHQFTIQTFNGGI
jgi:hypothetical protein